MAKRATKGGHPGSKPARVLKRPASISASVIPPTKSPNSPKPDNKPARVQRRVLFRCITTPNGAELILEKPCGHSQRISLGSQSDVTMQWGFVASTEGGQLNLIEDCSACARAQ